MPLRKEHAAVILSFSLSFSFLLSFSVAYPLTLHESRTASLNFEEGAKFYDQTRPDTILEHAAKTSFGRSSDLDPIE